MRGSSLHEALERQEEAWNDRPLLRKLYRDWYEIVAGELARVRGPTIELGSGIGRFKEIVPSAVTTDVDSTRWADRVVDAEALDFDDASVANLVLIDVFHHLARPARFFDESRRVLVPGGRVVILDPYCSPVSTLAYRRFHHERTDLRAPAFDDDPTDDSPLASNQARATLAFFREEKRFREQWPELAIVLRRRLALLAYPLSGGFSRPQLVPTASYKPLQVLERALSPLAPLAAFRCLVVLERV